MSTIFIPFRINDQIMATRKRKQLVKCTDGNSYELVGYVLSNKSGLAMNRPRNSNPKFLGVIVRIPSDMVTKIEKVAPLPSGFKKDEMLVSKSEIKNIDQLTNL